MRFLRSILPLILLLLLAVALPASAAGTITVVSRNSLGTATGNGASSIFNVLVSSNGTHVIYSSTANNLVSGVTDVNGVMDVFLYNSVTGTTTLVSRNMFGTGTANGLSLPTFVSADGSKVLFTSQATNLTSHTNLNGGGEDTYLFDANSGTVTLVSRNLAGTGTGNGQSAAVALSTDGSKVLFVSAATNLISLTDTNGGEDVFSYDVGTGVITLISRNLAGTGTGNGASQASNFFPDGSKILFTSAATNLTGFSDLNAAQDVFLYDVASGFITLVSLDGAGTTAANGLSVVYPAHIISGDGSKLLYQSFATNITGHVNNNGALGDAYLYDVATGISTLISHDLAGTGTGNGHSAPAQISSDGSTVAFASDSTNFTTLPDLNPGMGGPSAPDIFLYDVASGLITVVSKNAAGTQTGNQAAFASETSLSADGSKVIVISTATDLTTVPDTNSGPDAFLYDVPSDTMTLISQNTSGTAAANGASVAQWISADGSRILFNSTATDLTSFPDSNGSEDVFLYEVVNTAPTITSPNTATFYEGGPNSFTVTAAGDPVPTYTISGALPTGVIFNSGTGELSGVPVPNTAGSYPLTITASNGTSPDATQNFTLIVEKAAIVAEPVGNGSCTKMGSIVNMKLRGMIPGRQYTYTLEVRDATTVYMIRQFTSTFAGPVGTQINLKWVIFPYDNVPALDAPQTYNSAWTGLPASVSLRVTAVDRTTNLMTQTQMDFTCSTGVVSMYPATFTPNVTGAPYAP